MSQFRVASSSPRVLFGRILSISAAIALGAGLVASCGGGGATSAGATGGGGKGGGTSSACATDCSANKDAPVCDPASGKCVQCLPENDTCADGQYCDSTSNTCAVGCTA